jgi:hypothetical protein
MRPLRADTHKRLSATRWFISLHSRLFATKKAALSGGFFPKSYGFTGNPPKLFS